MQSSAHRGSLLLLLILSAGCDGAPESAAGTGGSGLASGGSGGGPTGGGANSGGSGGSGGTETGGASGFFGDSRCDAGTFLLCDGFESETIDSELWSIERAGENTVELDATMAARGQRSVHLRTQNGYAYLRHQAIFPVSGNAYWARMFLRVDHFSSVDWAHWTVSESAGTGDGSLIRVGGQFKTDVQKNRWGVGSDGGPTGDWTTHDTDPGGAPVEPGTSEWVCLEWRHDGATDVTQFFVDSVEHPSLATSATVHGGNAAANYVLPEFTSIWFGFWQYQADPVAFDVWIDEVAIASERIGCTL